MEGAGLKVKQRVPSAPTQKPSSTQLAANRVRARKSGKQSQLKGTAAENLQPHSPDSGEVSLRHYFPPIPVYPGTPTGL